MTSLQSRVTDWRPMVRALNSLHHGCSDSWLSSTFQLTLYCTLPPTSRIPDVPSRHLNIFHPSLLFVGSVRDKSTSIFLEEISETFVINSLILHRRYNPSKARPVSPVILLNVRDSLVMLCNPNTLNNTRSSLLLKSTTTIYSISYL